MRSSAIRRCDDFVGEVMARVPEGTPILVVSDHGFHSFRQSVNLNTWLVQRGSWPFRVRRRSKRAAGSVRRRNVLGERRLVRTRKAYAMGLGQIYVNLNGREAHGIVAPGDESKRLQDELVAQLLTIDRSEDRRADRRRRLQGRRCLFRRVHEERVRAPGRVRGWIPRLVAVDAGGSPPGLVYPNMKKWCGDHGSYRLRHDRRAHWCRSRSLSAGGGLRSSTSRRRSSSSSACQSLRYRRATAI